ncbi:hypothetical protein JTE90_008181 [Oedothorax gibbosus]|uniref:NADH dehydrogenase [ubiquinone] 1 beta subcomplex subunit 11, mitochondrial n=1 Tax=Oedothorax gibbosus TaxID=931172 RepID=A0AAV6VG73_9ARAC|nr:hypothetical protein JTE90_008181 [Oedothorax gibbosus]
MALNRMLCFVNPVLFRRIPAITSIKVANISTSNKKKDTLINLEDLFPKKPPSPPKTVEDFADTKVPKSWMSYGYDEENYEYDRFLSKVMNFTILTCLLCGGTFIFMYAPDVRNTDWAHREAFLEMYRREQLGLPLVDKNYVDPSKIELPSDEELGDTEIII